MTGTDVPAPAAPLSGVLIADFGRVLAAPYATMLLADLGADVIKVEHPDTGDDTRAWGPPHAHGESTYFLSVNRNKRSVALDLRDAADRRRAAELVRRADVLFENFRPGTMDKYGLGYDAARSLNPGVVYCSVTGFGTGEGAALPGYDLLVQAVGGLMSVTGPGPGEPVKAGVALVDVLTGLHAAIGVLAALRHRDATGEGQHVEVNLLSCLLSSLVNQAGGFTLAGSCRASWATATPPSRRTRSSVPRTAPGRRRRQRPAVRGAVRGPGRTGARPRPPLRLQRRPRRPRRRTRRAARPVAARAHRGRVVRPPDAAGGALRPGQRPGPGLRPRRTARARPARHAPRRRTRPGRHGEPDRPLPHPAPLRPPPTPPGRAHRRHHGLARLVTAEPYAR